jgi:glycosyltransferase involved in cell wall biosynthesis
MVPKLSIVIPTYHRAASLSKLIGAIRAQSLKGIETIVVDQNPPDFLSDALPKVDWEVIKHCHLDEPNASKARNVGFAQSSGEFILFIDDDLEPPPDFCEAAIRVLTEHKSVRCLCPVVYSDSKEEGIDRLKTARTGSIIPGTSMCEITESITAALFFERNYFIQTGGFDELLFRYARTAEDQEFFLRMGKRGLCVWLDTTLFAFHDERVPGGCGLRTEPYWKTRERCVKSWVFRYRTHGNRNGRLNYRDVWHLVRSSFLNRGILAAGAKRVFDEMKLLVKSISDCRDYLEPHLDSYKNVKATNYLAQYEVSSSR